MPVPLQYLEELVLQVLLLEGIHACSWGLPKEDRGAPGWAQVATVGQHLHCLLAQSALLGVVDDLLQPLLPREFLRIEPAPSKLLENCNVRTHSSFSYVPGKLRSSSMNTMWN